MRRAPHSGHGADRHPQWKLRLRFAIRRLESTALRIGCRDRNVATLLPPSAADRRRACRKLKSLFSFSQLKRGPARFGHAQEHAQSVPAAGSFDLIRVNIFTIFQHLRSQAELAYSVYFAGLYGKPSLRLFIWNQASKSTSLRTKRTLPSQKATLTPPG